MRKGAFDNTSTKELIDENDIILNELLKKGKKSKEFIKHAASF